MSFAPGGGTDLLARQFTQRFQEWYAQAAIVDNRPGAGGAIGAEIAAFSANTHIQAKRLKALAVSTKRRSPELPHGPTLDSVYPGFEADSRFALFVPAGAPQPVVRLLHDTMVKGIRHPSLKNFIDREGGCAMGISQDEFKAVLARDVEKYGKLVKSSGARPDH